jgi:hypothetical protein
LHGIDRQRLVVAYLYSSSQDSERERNHLRCETLLNYNAMIRDLFALLGEARARILANVQAIEARRDFWLATVDLHTALIGGSDAAVSELSRAAMPAAADSRAH